MSTTKKRGKHSSDDTLFSASVYPNLEKAVDDLCYVFSRGYGEKSALQMVGNRYRLSKRQRIAVLGMSCSDQEKANRIKSECEASDLEDRILEIDGFNILILIESALSGAYIFKGRDGLYRDISSVHGSYKRVVKTQQAIDLIGTSLKNCSIKLAKWYLDKPISNSGKLKTMLLESSEKNRFNWEVELVYSPDKVLASSEHIIVSSDSWILNHGQKWFNLGAMLIDNHIERPNIVAV